MNKKLTQLSELVAQANDVFFNANKQIATSIGIMDKVLRKQGMAADAITINCIALNKKIVFLLHDERPTSVEIGLGNNEGEIESSSQGLIAEVNVASIVDLMSKNFIK